MLRFCTVDVTIFRMLACQQGQSPETSAQDGWRHGTATDHRGCGLLGSSPWFDETSVECNSRGTDCRAVGIPVLYLATRYASLDALKYLTTHVEALSIGGRMRVILSPASVAAQVSADRHLAVGVEGWLNVPHAACAYGHLDVLRWALGQPITYGAGQRTDARLGRHVRPDLLLRDARGRLAIHYCALADDPQLLAALLSKTMVAPEQRRAQLMARDDEGRTAEELLSSRIIEEGREQNRISRNVRKRRKHQQKAVGGAQMHGQSMNATTSSLHESLRVIQAAKHDLPPQGDTSRGDAGPQRDARLEQQRHQRGRVDL